MLTNVCLRFIPLDSMYTYACGACSHEMWRAMHAEHLAAPQQAELDSIMRVLSVPVVSYTKATTAAVGPRPSMGGISGLARSPGQNPSLSRSMGTYRVFQNREPQKCLIDYYKYECKG